MMKTKRSPLLIIATILIATFVSCVAPNGIGIEVAALQHKLSQKADSNVVSKNIESLTQEVNQISETTANLMNWKKTINAETINYGGAGWVVLGLILMVMVFLSAIGLFLYFVFRYVSKYKGMLSLVTTAIHKSNPETIVEVKKQIKKHASNGDPRQQQHKTHLSKHCRQEGLFANGNV